MTLALRRIRLDSPELVDRASGVLKAAALASAGHARDVLEQARRDAERVLETAQAQAQEELDLQRQSLEEALWRSAADYARGLQAEWDQALDALEGRVGMLLGHAVRRLLAKTPAQEVLDACIAQLVAEIGEPDSGVLHVNPQDLQSARTLTHALPWPVQSSDDVPAGAVRLVAAQGRWDCGLESSIERMVAALGPGPASTQESDHG